MREPRGHKTVSSHTNEIPANFPLILNLVEQGWNFTVHHPAGIYLIGPATVNSSAVVDFYSTLPTIFNAR